MSNPKLSLPIAEDSMSTVDLTLPGFGAYRTSVVHQLWTLFANTVRARSQSMDDKVNNFIDHLLRLGLVPALTPTNAYEACYQLHTVGSAFDALQLRAMLVATGTACAPRYLAEPFVLPTTIKDKQNRVGLPRRNSWHNSYRVLPTTSASPGDNTRDECIPSSAVDSPVHFSNNTLNNAYSSFRTLKSEGSGQKYYCAWDLADAALPHIRSVQNYLHIPNAMVTPFCSVLHSITFNERFAGGFVSIGASGLYPVTEGFEGPHATPANNTFLSSFYTVMRLPISADASYVNLLTHASSSVLTSGEFSFHRMTDEVFYDGVTDLLACTPKEGTKFVFITDTITPSENNHAIPQKTATLPASFKTITHGVEEITIPVTTGFIALEYKGGKLCPTKSFLSKADTEFLHTLIAQCANKLSLTARVKEILKHI